MRFNGPIIAGGVTSSRCACPDLLSASLPLSVLPAGKHTFAAPSWVVLDPTSPLARYGGLGCQTRWSLGWLSHPKGGYLGAGFFSMGKSRSFYLISKNLIKKFSLKSCQALLPNITVRHHPGLQQLQPLSQHLLSIPAAAPGTHSKGWDVQGRGVRGPCQNTKCFYHPKTELTPSHRPSSL